MAKLNADENEFDEKLLLTKLKIDFSKQSAEVCDLNLEELYRLSIKFYKEKEGTKAIQMSYKEKIKLLAYTKQVTQGPYRQDAEIGFLDIVGNDRKQAWRSLGDMSKESAMFEFIKYLSKLCPLFTPYIKAHLAKLEEEQCQKSLESHQNHIDIEKDCNNLNHSNGYADSGEDNGEEKSDDNRKENEESKDRSSRGDSPFIGDDESAQIDEETKLLDAEKESNAAEESTELCKQDCEEETRLLDTEEVKKQQEDEQKMSLEKQIRATLMASMSLQFRQFAQQQFPDNAAEQDRLVDQLLEQQFQQFMQQLYGNQNQQFQPVLNSSSAAKPNDASSKEQAVTNENGQSANEVLDPNDLPPIESANTWTRTNVKEFKESLKDDPESVIKIGSGELVTVRVPTHDDGSCLFWEFATDGYDIGFGVYFEWYVASNEPEEDEEAEDEDEDAASQHHQPDVEADSNNGSEASATDPAAAPENEPPTEEIIPCYRRDCHEEIHCGSHIYPGRGIYLLKFDNSYSLWRGKTVYYRVYYTR